MSALIGSLVGILQGLTGITAVERGRLEQMCTTRGYLEMRAHCVELNRLRRRHLDAAKLRFLQPGQIIPLRSDQRCDYCRCVGRLDSLGQCVSCGAPGE